MAETGAKPIKNRPTKELTPKQKKHLQEHFRVKSDKELARDLRLDKGSIRKAMIEMGLNREETAAEAPVSLKFHLLTAIVLALSVALSYGHTLNYAFHFDDLKTFVENVNLHIQRLSWESLAPIFSSNRPVANLTYAINFYFDRLEPRGYHLVNILIHFLTAVIIYFLFLKTLSLSRIEETFSKGSAGAAPWAAQREKISFLGALLWAVHPVQTQAVTYVVQRMAGLAAFFYLLSLLSYVHGRLSRGKGGPIWFALSAVSAFMAFGTKENTLTLPAIVFLYDIFFISRFKIHLSLRQVVIFAGLLGAGLAGIAWLMKLYAGTSGLLGLLSANYGTEDMDAWLRVMTEWRVIFLYISLLLFPYPGRMNLDYDFPFSNSLFDPVTTLLSLLGILFFLGFAVRNAKKYPLLSFSILWFFINLAIESSFIKLDLVFEHRLYLPSVMLFLLFSVGIFFLASRIPNRFPVLKLAAGTVLAASLIFTTHERNKVWRTSVTLWSDAVAKAPNKSRVVNNLGKAYLEEEQWDKAKFKFMDAVRLNPKNQEALNNLGNAYQREGNMELAVKYYQAVLDLNGNNPLAHNDLGVALQSMGKSDQALARFKEAIRLDPNYTDAHNNLGNIYLLSNQLDLAVVEYQKTLELNPKHPMAHTNLGILYQKKGMLKEAMTELEQGLKLNPRSSTAQFNYGYFLETMGRKDEAIRHYEEAVKWASPQEAGSVEILRKRLKELKG